MGNRSRSWRGRYSPLPSLTTTRAQLVMTGGEGQFVPARFQGLPAAIVMTGRSATMGPGTNFASVTPTKFLNRAQRQVPIGEVRGGAVYITEQEQTRQQRYAEGIERALASLTGQVTDLTAIVERLAAAEAQAAAAQQQATATAAADALTKSYVSPSSVLTASSSGSVTIAAHTRVYGNGSSAAVNAGSLSGFAAGTYLTIYYEDAAREGGAVVYQATTDLIAQVGTTHIVGSATIPAPGQVDSGGTTVPPPGYIPQKYTEFEVPA